MRAVEPRGRVGFAAEPLHERVVLSQMRRQQFDRHNPVGHRVVRAPHLAHAAAAQQLDKAITPERRALHRAHHTQPAATPTGKPATSPLATAVERQPEVVRFLAYTGLRWGEMAALRVQDFDMLRRRVNVSRSVTESGGLVWSTPKTWERRSVPFPAALADELAALMVGKGRDELVFTDLRGGVLRNSNWRARVFEPAVQKCQKADESFPSITPHDLRHTAASLAVSAGANVKAVQRMLGHAKASMTLDIYADLFDEDLDGVADRLDAAIQATADALQTASEA